MSTLSPLRLASLVVVGLVLLCACQPGQNEPVVETSASPSGASSALALQAVDAWRQHLRTGSVAYLRDLRAIDPAFEEADLVNGLDTCLDLLRQEPTGRIVIDAKLRFSTPATGPLTDSQATKVVSTTLRSLCPGLSWIARRTR